MAAVIVPSFTCVALAGFAGGKKLTGKKARGLTNHESRRRRLVHLADVFAEFLDRWQPVVACIEEASYPRGANAQIAMAMSHGMVYTACASRGIPMVTISPRNLKMGVTGCTASMVPKVTDAQLRRILYNRYPDAKRLVSVIQSDEMQQHPLDGLGAIHALRNNEVVLATTKATKGHHHARIPQATRRP